MKITKRQKEIILPWLKADIDAADRHYQDVLQDLLIKRWRRWQADKSYYQELFPNLSERCSFVMSDVWDTILWMMPSLMRIFFGGTEVVTLSGRTVEDDPKAMQALIQWQVTRQNRGFLQFYRWFVEALWAGMGVMKVRWERIEGWEEETATMPADLFLEMDEKAAGIDVMEADETPDGQFRVKGRRQAVTSNRPVLEVVPLSEFRFLPNAATCRDLPFCAHKRLMSRSDIQERVNAGEWDEPTQAGLDAARYQAGEDSELRSLLVDEDAFNDGAAEFDPSRELYWVYECAARYDINEDNVSEHLIVTLIGEDLVSVQANDLKRPHFAILSPYPDQFQITGKGVDDLVGEIQDIKTALIRQIILNVGNNNDRQAVVDEDKLNPDDLRNNRRYVRARNLNGAPASSAISYFPEAPLGQGAIPLLDLMQDTAETRSGVTKYTQGLDRRGLNKTATGVEILTQSANQRMEMVARMFAETGVYDLFDLLVQMNSRYMDQETVVRLTNGEQLQVRPDDLSGAFDIEIAAGVSAGQQETAVAQMKAILAEVYPTMAQMGLPPTPENVHAVGSRLLANMGYKNPSEFIPDVDMAALFQQMQGQIAELSGALQATQAAAMKAPASGGTPR